MGVISLAVPYRTLELGLDAVLPMVNSEMYPIMEYPYGQFDYQRYYELHSDHAKKKCWRRRLRIRSKWCL